MYCARSPFHHSHVYGRIKISRTLFEKDHPRNIPVKLFQNQTSSYREEDFLRISSCPYGARSPHSLEPCLWTDQNFANNCLKRVTQGKFLWIYLKIGPRFKRKKNLKNCLKNSISLPWQPEFLINQIV